MLDEFKSAGVFVNWWQQIRFDLKTIVSIGWHHSLVPDDYLIRAFFQAEADEIESLEASIGQAQGELAEAVESAQEVAAYESDEGEKVTAAILKKVLKALIADLKDSPAIRPGRSWSASRSRTGFSRPLKRGSRKPGQRSRTKLPN